MVIINLRILAVGIDAGDAGSVGAYGVANQVLDGPQESRRNHVGAAVVGSCAVEFVGHGHARAIEVPSTGMSTNLLAVDDGLVVVLRVAQEYQGGNGIAQGTYNLSALVSVHDQLVELPAVAHVQHGTRAAGQGDGVVVVHVDFGEFQRMCPLFAVHQLFAAVAHFFRIGLDVLHAVHKVGVNTDLERQGLLALRRSQGYFKTCFLASIPRSLQLFTP